MQDVIAIAVFSSSKDLCNYSWWSRQQEEGKFDDDDNIQAPLHEELSFYFYPSRILINYDKKEEKKMNLKIIIWLLVSCRIGNLVLPMFNADWDFWIKMKKAK